MSHLRYAVRCLARVPSFTIVSLLLLALGIGANAAFFSVIQAQVLAPFPYPDADRVVQVWRSNGSAQSTNPWSSPDFWDVHDRATSFAALGAYGTDSLTLGGTTPRSILAIACTPGVLQALGLQPTLGRWLTEEDERTGAAPVVVLSYQTWVNEFGADPALVGRPIRLGGQERTVVGVMPANFEFYCPWTADRAAAVWVPLQLARDGGFRGNHSLLVVGRLKSDVSLATAKAELRTLSRQLEAAYPDTNYGKWFYPLPLAGELLRRAAMRYTLVVAAILLVLIAVCANLSLMHLARGAGRQAEYAVRLALGATRRDLLKLACAESTILALGGAGLGMLVAWNLTGWLGRIFPPVAAHGTAVAIDSRVVGYALALALVSAFVAGLPPALAAAKTDVIASIKESGTRQAGARLRRTFLRHLVSGQIAIALVLVNTALLLLSNHRHSLAATEPLASEYVLTARLTLAGPGYDSNAKRDRFWASYLERVRRLPGVTSAAVTTKLPLGGGNNATVLIGNESFDPTVRRPLVERSWVSADYFAAMGIARHTGRAPAPTDAQPATPSVLINRRFATQGWPGVDPIGRTFRNDGAQLEYTATVVGVVDDVRQWDIGWPAECEMYLPYELNPSRTSYLVLRSAQPARQFAPVLRRELAALDPSLALAQPNTMAEVVSAAARDRQTVVLLTNVFMVITVALTGVGIYGTLSFQTRQRTREIGVRIALGAAGSNIVDLVVRQALPSLLVGGGIGLLLSLGIAIALRRGIADVNPLDPSYYVGGAAVLTLAVVLACWLPARRAMRISPVDALRAD